MARVIQPLSESPETLGAMHERKNYDPTWRHLIHQPIRPYEQFPDGFIAEFRNGLTAFRKVSE